MEVLTDLFRQNGYCLGWFPSPLEVTGVSNAERRNLNEKLKVSVPSRGEWGFLQDLNLGEYGMIWTEFPSPLEVTGVSY